MELAGYQPQKIKPWEAASGETAVVCPVAKCSASTRFEGVPGWYELRVQYFDMPKGTSRFHLFVNDQEIDEWVANDKAPARKLDASASTRRAINGIQLRRGDQVRIEGIPDEGEQAPLDYIEIQPEKL